MCGSLQRTTDMQTIELDGKCRLDAKHEKDIWEFTADNKVETWGTKEDCV